MPSAISLFLATPSSELVPGTVSFVVARTPLFVARRAGLSVASIASLFTAPRTRHFLTRIGAGLCMASVASPSVAASLPMVPWTGLFLAFCTPLFVAPHTGLSVPPCLTPLVTVRAGLFVAPHTLRFSGPRILLCVMVPGVPAFPASGSLPMVGPGEGRGERQADEGKAADKPAA